VGVNASQSSADKLPHKVVGKAILGGMVSFLDAGLIVTGSISFVRYTEAGFGIGAWEMGLLSSLITCGLAVGAVIGGWFGDRYGRHLVFTIGLLVMTAGLAFLTFSPSMPWLIPGAAIAGFAAGASLPVSIALVAEQGPVGQRGRLVGITSAMWAVGIVASVITANVMDLLRIPNEPAARIQFAVLLVAAVVVWFLRGFLSDSTEWSQATAESAESDAEAPGWRGLWHHRGLLVATGFFYLLWNLSANTGGQYSAYIFTQIAGGELATSNLLGLVMMPVSLTATLLGLKLMDTRWRIPGFIVGGIVGVLMMMLPAAFGVTVPMLIIGMILPSLFGAFSSENIYKIWIQESFPASIRTTAQGATIFFCRLLTAAFALVTPVILAASPQGLYWFLTVTTAISLGIGWWYLFRKPAVRTDEGAD
jgi:inositol transporter-like SP family MFS transporter